MKPAAVKQIVVFGEVLFDCFPDGRRILGGAPFNVAWHLHAFKARPLFISRIGDDSAGAEIKSAMQEWGMETGGLQLDYEHPSGRVSVHFNDGEPEYDIVADTAYDFIDADQLPNIENDCIIYHGSLALRNQISLLALNKLKQTGSAKCFVDINIRPPWWQSDLICDLLKDAQWLKINDQEFSMLSTKGVFSQQLSVDQLMENNSMEMLLLTCGAEGAQLICNNGFQYEVKPEPRVNVIDTVGAGDAFSSVILLGLLNHWQLPVMLQRAQDFASAVVGIRGAISSDAGFYQDFIDAWELC